MNFKTCPTICTHFRDLHLHVLENEAKKERKVNGEGGVWEEENYSAYTIWEMMLMRHKTKVRWVPMCGI